MPPVSPKKAGLVVYPNPTSGQLSVRAISSGKLSFFDLQGRQIAAYNIATGENIVQLPDSLSAGIYTGRFLSTDGKESDIVRIIYQP